MSGFPAMVLDNNLSSMADRCAGEPQFFDYSPLGVLSGLKG